MRTEEELDSPKNLKASSLTQEQVVASFPTTTCQHCIHWDADNQFAYAQGDYMTARRCTLVGENDRSALITIAHRQYAGGKQNCHPYLVTKGNFTCGAAQRRDGIPEQADIDMEDQETRPQSLAGQVAKGTIETALWMADLTIDYILRRRQDERTIRPTKRITFPASLKRQLLVQQNRQCMYCGERKSIRTTDIDHKHPVVRGGKNEKANLQLLCKPCNQRKGMQTDEEFRERYARLLPKSRRGQEPTPPKQPIPQKAFRQLTKETRLADTAKQFKRTKYISPRQKISTGTPFAGAIVGGVCFFGTALILPQEAWAGNLSLVSGLLTGVGTWAGLLARAKHTGKFDM